jgi:hypothetical protein
MILLGLVALFSFPAVFTGETEETAPSPSVEKIALSDFLTQNVAVSSDCTS